MNKNVNSESGMTLVWVSYLLWLGCFMFFCGLHRFYNRRYLSGFIWLFTGGILGIGQLIDLLLIPSMVEDHNLKRRALLNGYPSNGPVIELHQQINLNGNEIQQTKFNDNEIQMRLLQEASKRGGKLSVTQGAMATGLSFEEVEKKLTEMLKSGHINIDNDPKTGIVIYDFHEL